MLERTEVHNPNDPERMVRHYAVRHLKRLSPGYTLSGGLRPPGGSVRRAAGSRQPPGRGLHGGRPAGVDMLRKARVGAKVTPLFVTSGKGSSSDERGGWLVSRQELAATLQVLLQSRRLRVAPALPESATLVRELAAFQVKTTAAAKEELDAWREGAHDDLVLAVAVGAWLGEHAMRQLVVWL